MVTFHQIFVFSHCKSFYLSDQIKRNCKYWMHWKSEEKRTEPNELDELKWSKSLNRTTSYAHWNAFLYLHAHINTFLNFSIKNQKKKELNELRELEYLKKPSQMSSLFVSACWNMYQNVNLFIAFEIGKKTEQNELYCSKTLLQMSSYALKHVFCICMLKHA